MRTIKFEYGFSSVNGIIKKQYYLHEISSIKEKCDVWNVLPIAYVRQFTGLHDKNGKEIYEGDILEDSLGRKKLVEYFKDGFWLNASFDGAEWCLRQVNSSSKIIGNVYENPELISKTSTHEH